MFLSGINGTPIRFSLIANYNHVKNFVDSIIINKTHTDALYVLTKKVSRILGFN